MVGAYARRLLGWSRAYACCVFTPPALTDQALEAGGRKGWFGALAEVGAAHACWQLGVSRKGGHAFPCRENRRFAKAGVLSRSPARQGAPLRVCALLQASLLPLGRAAGLALLCWWRLDAPVRRVPCTLQSSEVWLAVLVSWGSWWEPL